MDCPDGAHAARASAMRVMKNMKRNFTITPALTPLVAAVLAASVSALVLLPVLEGEYLTGDDYLYVLGNPHISSLGLNTLRAVFFGFYESTWFPLTYLTHALDFALWGSDPSGPHMLNLLMHWTVVLFAALIARKLLARRQAVCRGGGDEAGCLAGALVAGLLVGIHPLSVEPVAWITGRKDLMSGLFFYPALLSYIRYIEGAGRGEPGARRWMGLSAALYMASMLGKPASLMLPAVLLLIDYFPYRRHASLSWGALIREKAVFIIIGVCLSAIGVWAQYKGTSLRTASQIPPVIYALMPLKHVGQYAARLMFPIDLMPFHPYPSVINVRAPGFVLPIAGGLALLAAWAAGARRYPWAFTAVGLGLVMVSPFLGVPQIGKQEMADRYLYLPGFGFALICAGACASLLGACRTSLSRAAVLLLTAGMLSAYGTAAHRQTSVWHDSVSLWSRVIERSTVDSAMPFNNRGTAYADREQHGLAVWDFTWAIAYEAELYQPYLNRGASLAKLGEYGLARADFDEAARRMPHPIIEVYIARAELFMKTGQYEAAIYDFLQAYKINPDSGWIVYRLANASKLYKRAKGRADGPETRNPG